MRNFKELENFIKDEIAEIEAIAYKEFSGGSNIRLTIDDLKGDKEKSIIKIMLTN